MVVERRVTVSVSVGGVASSAVVVAPVPDASPLGLVFMISAVVVVSVSRISRSSESTELAGNSCVRVPCEASCNCFNIGAFELSAEAGCLVIGRLAQEPSSVAARNTTFVSLSRVVQFMIMVASNS